VDHDPFRELLHSSRASFDGSELENLLARDAKERCRSIARPSTGALCAPAQGEDKLLMALRKILILSARVSAQSKDAHRAIQRSRQFFLTLSG